MCLFGSKTQPNINNYVDVGEPKQIELEPSLKTLFDEGKCVKFTKKVNDDREWCLINFEKDNYTIKFSHMNYNIPLKIYEMKDYEISLKGRYPQKYSYCDRYVGGKLPDDDKDYVYISLKISINEHNGFEYYSVIESVGFRNDLKPMYSYVKIYKMPPNIDTLHPC